MRSDAISARVNLSLVDRALNAIRRPDLRPAWKESRKPLRADQREHQKRQEGPDGTWAPRAASTKARYAQRKKRRTPKLLGRLPTATTTSIARSNMVLRSVVKWSGVHKSGGTAGHGAKIPARDFLYASDKVLAVIAGIVSKAIGRLFRRGR